jgi:hypothetical protein
MNLEVLLFLLLSPEEDGDLLLPSELGQLLLVRGDRLFDLDSLLHFRVLRSNWQGESGHWYKSEEGRESKMN